MLKVYYSNGDVIVSENDNIVYQSRFTKCKLIIDAGAIIYAQNVSGVYEPAIKLGVVQNVCDNNGTVFQTDEGLYSYFNSLGIVNNTNANVVTIDRLGLYVVTPETIAAENPTFTIPGGFVPNNIHGDLDYLPMYNNINFTENIVNGVGESVTVINTVASDSLLVFNYIKPLS